jgi:CRISPR system Cascade subunit CasD
VQSRFTVRDTLLEPTKSGVLGLVGAALGRDRAAPIDDLARLAMGVRVDREGLRRRDYHTAGQSGFLRARGAVERRDVVPSDRFYLSDARFLVGLEGSDLSLLRRIDAALRDPHWPLALGRKAFPPGEPVALPASGVRPQTRLLDALRGAPWEPSHGQRTPENGELRYVVEIGALRAAGHAPEVERTQPDQPLSFQPRRFAQRTVGIVYLDVPEDAPA